MLRERITANLCYLTSVTLKSRSNQIIGCSLMRLASNKNVMILASSVHDK
jgi:hypothetical protein